MTGCRTLGPCLLMLTACIATACEGGAPTGVAEAPAGATSAAPDLVTSDTRPIRVVATGGLLGQRFAPGFPSEPSVFGGRCSVPAHFMIRFSISGEATLGGSAGPVTGELEHCSVIDFQTGISRFVDGVLSLAAPNGDELLGAYEGGSKASGGFEDEVVFTGGTGRFAGISGTGVQRGACDRATGVCSYELDGSISYDG